MFDADPVAIAAVDTLDALLNALGYKPYKPPHAEPTKKPDKQANIVNERVPRPVDIYVDRIVANGPVTIVFWKDGTKTIVRCSPDDHYSVEQGFAAALAKHLYGGKNESGSALKKFVAAHLQKASSKNRKQPQENAK